MKEVTLAAKLRSETGKGAARQLRMAGNIPAVVYGPETEAFSVEVAEKDLRNAVKEATSTSAIFDLDIDGKQNKVIIRDIQRDPVTSKVTHVDFHAISMNKPIHITVPIHITGTAVGVKTDGGILQTVMRELDVSCLPKDIPDHIEIDVDELSIGDSIHVRDIEVPNVTILSEERRTIVVVAAPTVTVEPETEEEEGEEGIEGEEGAAEGAEGADGAAPAEGADAAKDDKADKKKK